MKYKAVCFDFDYTLGDATDAVVAGYTYGLTRLGWPVPEREAVRRTIGLMLEDGYLRLTGDADSERQRQFRKLFVEVADPMQRTTAKLFPGARELLCALKENGVRLGIISSKGNGTLRAVLENLELLDMLDLVLGNDAVTHHKPDPEGILTALDRFGVRREELLYCGDSLVDAKTAENAGVDFCGVLNGTTTAQELETMSHVHVASDLKALLSWLNGN